MIFFCISQRVPPALSQRVKRKPQQFAEWYLPFIDGLDEFVNRLACRYDVGLLIAARPVAAHPQPT
jgi:hypothetical protein